MPRLRFLSFVALSVVAVACSSGEGGGSPIDDAGSDGAVDTSTDDATADADEASGDADDALDVTDAATCTSGLTQPTPACEACQDAHCCIVASDCAATKSKWSCSAAKVCRENACATECAVTAATCGNIIPNPASCTDASRAACCDELSACGQSDECLALIYICIDEQACDPTMPCFKDCKTKWPAGATVFAALDKCSSKVSCP